MFGMKLTKREWIQIALSVALVILSVTLLRAIFTSPKLYQHTMRILDTQKQEALAISVSVATASTAISALSNLTLPLFLIVVIIYLEEYLLTAFGAISTCILIPITLALNIGHIIFKRDIFAHWAKKIFILAIVTLVLIPSSAMVTDHMKNALSEINELKLQFLTDITDEVMSEEETSGVKAFFSGVANSVSNAVGAVENTASAIVDTVVVLFITSFVVPLMTLWIFIEVIKSTLNQDISMNKLNMMMNRMLKEMQSSQSKGEQDRLMESQDSE